MQGAVQSADCGSLLSHCWTGSEPARGEHVWRKLFLFTLVLSPMTSPQHVPAPWPGMKAVDNGKMCPQAPASALREVFG